ncbi:MAG: hypothetical protein GX323_07975 [Clostridiales bacterium]|nr:hypothetical protein [Clostridiales bacterium]
MKKGKFSKFLLGSAAVAGVAVGAYYLYKNFMNKDYTDDFDDFDDDFDDDFFDDITVDDLDEEDDESTREYVSINISSSSEEDKVTTEEDVVAEEVDTDATIDVNQQETN